MGSPAPCEAKRDHAASDSHTAGVKIYGALLDRLGASRSSTRITDPGWAEKPAHKVPSVMVGVGEPAICAAAHRCRPLFGILAIRGLCPHMDAAARWRSPLWSHASIDSVVDTSCGLAPPAQCKSR